MKMYDKEDIIARYKQGESSHEIAASLPITPRQVQRIIKSAGISRTVKEAFNLAIKKGRVAFRRKETRVATRRLRLSPSLRYKILERDNFRCVFCGATAKDDVLEIDHIDSNYNNNEETNLRVLCNACNVGRPSPNRKNITAFQSTK